MDPVIRHQLRQVKSGKRPNSDGAAVEATRDEVYALRHEIEEVAEAVIGLAAALHRGQPPTDSTVTGG